MKLINILSTIGPESCPKYCNLHSHTQFSDGSLTPLQLIEQASFHKIKNISVTDHHSVSAYYYLNEWIMAKEDNGIYVPKLWNGIEISALLGGCLVHILGFDFNLAGISLIPYIQGEAATGEYLRANTVVKAIHDSGGLAILAHPARYRRPYQILLELAAETDFDGAEVWYDYDMTNEWKPTPHLCESISRHLKNLDMLPTCGTDTHGLNILSR